MNGHRPEFRFYYFTPAYDETVAFYRDVLRFSVYRSWDRGSADRGTIFVSPNGRGLIEIEAGARLPAIDGGFYIEVPDVDEWHQRVHEAGAAITRSVSDTEYGHRNFKVIDPSGIEVTFFRYLVEPA